MSADTITADDVRDRPHPKQMDVDEMRTEAAELAEPYKETADGDLSDAIEWRWRLIYQQLRDRTDVEFPDCPECGRDDSWGRDRDGGIRCGSCEHYPRGALLEEVRTAKRQLWGQESAQKEDDA